MFRKLDTQRTPAQVLSQAMPPVTLTVTDVETGKEDEAEIWKEESIWLYRFTNGEWKEQSGGVCKILKHKVTGDVRFLMGDYETRKIR